WVSSGYTDAPSSAHCQCASVAMGATTPWGGCGSQSVAGGSAGEHSYDGDGHALWLPSLHAPAGPGGLPPRDGQRDGPRPADWLPPAPQPCRSFWTRDRSSPPDAEPPTAPGADRRDE